jgi:stage III sporulation protein AE
MQERQGRRAVRSVAGIVAVLLALLFTALPVSGAETDASEALLDGYESMKEAIPEEITGALPPELLSGDLETLDESVGRMLDVSYFLGLFGEAIGLAADDAVRLLLTLLGILILSAVFSSVRGALRMTARARVFSSVMQCAVLLTVAETQTALFESLRSYFSSLTALAGGMLPITGVLYAVGGNVTGASTGSAAMSIFLAVSEFVGGELLFPTIGACMALSMVSVLAPSLNVRSLSACIKRTFTFVLGFLMMLLSALLAMRSGLAAKADSVGARTVKYVASSVIPVVGGSVADSLRTVGASVEYLRTTVGVAGILLIVILLLPVLVNVLLTRFALIVSTSAAELLGCEGESRLLSELVSLYGYILAVAAMCALMFIFALTVFVRTAAAV